MRKVVRRLLDRFAPRPAQLYRIIRDEITTRRTPVTRMPEGFLAVGDPSMRAGRFEPRERRLVPQLLQNADVFVDIGANIGYYSCIARVLGKRVVAIEPVPTNYNLLLRAIDANGWDDVEVWPVAVADRTGTTTIYGANTAASLVPEWAGTSNVYHQTIPVTTLDTILENRFGGERMVVKMDVEGAEYRALLGARSVLARTPKPIWLVEATIATHHSADAGGFRGTFELFWNNGYGARSIDEGAPEVTPADVERWIAAGGQGMPSYNWIFEPKTS